MTCFTKLHLISGRLRLRVVCLWVSNGILVALESWHTLHSFFQMRPLKQGCKVSQSEHYSAEVSLPKNWVNEKPKSLIELNTLSYAAVLPSLPPTMLCAFIFFPPPHNLVFCFFFLWQLCELWWWKRSMCIVYFSLCSSALHVSMSRGSREPASQMSWGRDLQLTSLIMRLKQLVSTSAMRTWTAKRFWAIYIYLQIFC